MEKGRRVAFDFGDVRIGVAVSDVDSILAIPHLTLRTGDAGLAKALSAILLEINPIKIYVGRPILLSGNDGTASKKVEGFVEFLGSLTQVPIELIDERMSTLSAARSLRDSGRDAKNSKKVIDMASAVSILEFAIAIEKARI